MEKVNAQRPKVEVGTGQTDRVNARQNVLIIPIKPKIQKILKESLIQPDNKGRFGYTY